MKILLLFTLCAVCHALTTGAEKCCASTDASCIKNAIDEIKSHNHDRRQDSRVATGFIFLFITLGYLCQAACLAFLMGWIWQPLNRLILKKKKDATEKQLVVYNTIGYGMFFAALIIILTAGGLTAWMILGFIFFITMLSVTVVAIMVMRRARKIIPVDATQIQKEKTKEKWTAHPKKLGRRQAFVSIVLAVTMVVFLIIVLIIFYAWKPKAYYVWSHDSKCQLEEYIPPTTARALALMYSFEAWAENVRIGVYAKVTTSYCGKQFSKILTSAEKDKQINQAFIKLYNIDMSLYVPQNYMDYESVNAWFVRRINPTARPLVNVSEDQVVSPADCRMLIYPAIDDSSVWVKGKKLSVAELLDVPASHEWASLFQGGTLVIARLAPQDYHRFNTPIGNATIAYQKAVQGTYWSVSADAATSANKAFYNLRQVIILKSPRFGTVAYVAIGATCVGSVIVGKKVGDVVNLPEELGYMQFGGSTVILLFEKGKVDFEKTIVDHSMFPVESYVKVNQQIGYAKN